MVRIKFDITGKSVTGASHSKDNLPNQDCICYTSGTSNDRDYGFCIVSDGHGSKKCFRSHVGSSLAVKGLSALFHQLAVNKMPAPSHLKRYVIEELPKAIVSLWRELVTEHIYNYPFSAADIALASSGAGNLSNEDFSTIQYVPYGATLLGVLTLPEAVIYVQIGDGDILLANETGEVLRRLADDENCLGNEVTSLCLENSENFFRTAIDFIVDIPPYLTVITSDGFTNAYKDDTELFMFPLDLIRLYKEKGFDLIKENLFNWLEETSVKATGDDVSMCLMFPQFYESSQVVEMSDSPPYEQINIATDVIDDLPSYEKQRSFLDWLRDFGNKLIN